MGSADDLLKTLRGLDDSELRAIRRRFGWTRIDSMDNRQEYTKRLKHGIERRINDDKLSYKEFIEKLREDIILPGGKQPRTQIKDLIENFTVSQSPIGEERKEEEWITSQLYGCLQTGLHDSFRIYLEYQIDPHSKQRADILIKEPEGDSVFVGNGDFLIESKLAKNTSAQHVENQIRSYHSSEQLNNRQHTYVVLICRIDESEMSGNSHRQVVNPEETDKLDGNIDLEKFEEK